MEKKYKFSGETKMWGYHTLHRIEALRSFSNVKKGDKGGWVESESNLSHSDDCWVGGNAIVCDNAWVCDNARVSDNARVYGYADVCGDAVIEDDSDYLVFKNFWSSGRYFTWTRSNNMWKVGCFHGTGEELVKKAFADDEEKGEMYKSYVEFVESVMKKYKSFK